jgi:serine/threonine-protein kinase HipA
MGALTYEPTQSPPQEKTLVELSLLAKDTQTVLSGEDTATLRQLVLLGGSPQGARPKVLANYDLRGQLVSTCAARGYVPWIFKFPNAEDHKEVCALEALYADLARICDLDMPDTRHFDLGRGLAAFGAARFDVEEGMRVPVHSLAGALHADFRVPAVDYTTLLRATRLFTRDEREVLKAFERAAFNVLFNNRDDHSKNFSFRLGRDLQWRLAPCYDLTFSEGAGGEHQMDVCGEGRHITRALMLQLASQGGLSPKLAAQSLDRIVAQSGRFRALTSQWEIRRATVEAVTSAIEANRVRLHK